MKLKEIKIHLYNQTIGIVTKTKQGIYLSFFFVAWLDLIILIRNTNLSSCCWLEVTLLHSSYRYHHRRLIVFFIIDKSSNRQPPFRLHDGSSSSMLQLFDFAGGSDSPRLTLIMDFINACVGIVYNCLTAIKGLQRYLREITFSDNENRTP